MTLLLMTTLLVSGLGSLSSSVPRQFHVVKEQKSWTEAQQYCREEFTDLATIDDMTEMEKVKSKIHAGVNAWIGLKRESSPKWQWSLADRDFYREQETEFRNWATGQPNGGREECVLMWRGGKWHDFWCRESRPFICYDGGNSTHPYVLVTERKNWADAQRYCREKHTDLASVRNQEENDQIEQVRGNINRGAWIGLFRDAWEWSDGSSSSFRHWGAGEPDNKGVACTEIMPSGLWKDADCQHNDGSHFICYEDELVLVRENKTWREALQYCRDHHVDLVSVTSERVQRWVSERAKGASTAHVWVGLVHSYGLGWFWVCGQTICYSNWTQGHQQVESFHQGVGAVESGGGQWVSNLTKTDQLNFICTTKEQCG
ncbi:C-type mannose receptor 2-like [Sardina pilchardus]|uniref:C-type mannose receptor 2-like n=1 Tax=Sardina pilchardus TaxID=27697 RepID=UPI002E119F0F